MLHASASPDFTHLTVLAAAQQGPTRSLRIATFETPVLHARRCDIGHLARGAHRVQFLFGATEAAIATCLRTWSEASKALSTRFDALLTLLRDHNAQSSAADEMMSLLATGIVRCYCSSVLLVSHV